MSDVLSLFIILCLLYLAEGLWWAPLDAVVLSRGFWGRFRAAAPLPLRRDARAGGVPPRHLVATASRFVCRAWPIALAPGGVAASGETLSFEEARSLAAVGPRLLREDRAFARAASAREARALLNLVRRIDACDRRDRAIADAIDAALDDREARRRARRLRWALRRFRWLPGALFANLFVLGPVLFATLGVATWPIPAALHAALAASAAVAFVRVDRKLYPDRGDRFTTVVTMLLFPPAAARYAELLSRDLMAGLHPLAVAAALDRDLLDELARRTLRESRRGASESHENDAEAWYRRAFEARVSSALERYGLDPRALDEPPPPEAGAVAYCPRCLAQYRSQARDCADCEGIALVPLGTG